MGAFDDLIPSRSTTARRSSGLFDDLIPSEPAPEPRQPEGPEDLRSTLPRGVIPGRAAEFDRSTPRPERRGLGAGQSPMPRPRPEPDPYADESFGDLATRRGQEVGQGFSGVIQSIARARSIDAATLDRAIKAQAPERVQQARQTVENMDLILESGVSPLSGEPMSEEERKTYEQRRGEARVAVESWLDRGEAGILPVEQRTGAKVAERIKEWTDDTIGEPPRDDSFWSQLAYGGGSMAAFVLPGLAGPVGLAGTAQMGADAAKDEAYTSAKQAGATDEQAETAAQIAGFVGYSEVVPIAAAFRAIPDPLRRKLTAQIGRIVSGTAAGSIEEAVQEGFMAASQNLIAQGIYDPDRGIMEGVGEQALVGAILGGFLGAGGAAMDRRSEPTNLEPGDIESPIQNDVISQGRGILDAIDSGEPIPTRGLGGGAAREPQRDEDTADLPEGAVPMDTLYPEAAPAESEKISEDFQNQPEAPEASTAPERPGTFDDLIPEEAAGAADAEPAPEPTAEELRKRIEGLKRGMADMTRLDTESGIAATDSSREGRQEYARAIKDAEAKLAALEGDEGGSLDSIPDPLLADIFEILDGSPMLDGRRLSISDEERQTLRRAGVQVGDDNSLPASEAQRLIDERFDRADRRSKKPKPASAAPSAAPARGLEVLDRESVQNIETDAETFQYKSGADAEGVTDRLRGVEKWDPTRAGVGIIYEYEDGRRVMADGHQRLALAKRASAEGQEIDFPTRVFREADGYTEADVRAIAAAKNIAEGTGSALDAAKVFRDTRQTAKDLNLPRSSQMVRDAEGLAQLSDQAFGMVVNEVVSESHGAIVGRLVEDTDRQADILGLVAKLQPANITQAESIVRQAKEAEAPKETQTTLFGEEEVAANLYLERAKVLDRAIKDLGRDIQTFKTLTDRGETIASAGNVLQQDANQARLSADAQARAVLMKQANTKGPISDALSEAARAVKAGRPVAEAARGFIAAVRGADGQSEGGREPARDTGSRDEAAAPEGQQEAAVERTPEGEQYVAPGVAPISDKDREQQAIRAGQKRPLEGGEAEPPGGRGGLFGDASERADLFDQPAAPKDEGKPWAEAEVGDRLRGADRNAYKAAGKIRPKKDAQALADELGGYLTMDGKTAWGVVVDRPITKDEADAALAKVRGKGQQKPPAETPTENQAVSGGPAFSGERADDTSKLTLEEQDRLAELRSKFRNKIKNQLNAGLDPELVSIAAEMASIYIKAGARKFRDLLRAMMEDLGLTFEQAQPYARNAYNQARDDMDLRGESIADMDDAAAVLAEVKALREAQPAPAPIKKPEANPSEAQKEAGNYKMGHVSWNGLDITIETAKGQERRGRDSDGEEWSVTMPAHYGYIKGTNGRDGDHVDIYLGDDRESDQVFIVNQVDADTGAFDEHKVILGTSFPTDALELYRAGFSDGRANDRFGSMTPMTVEEFKTWLAEGDQQKPTRRITRPYKGVSRETEPEGALAPRDRTKLIDGFYRAFKGGESFATITQARRSVEDFIGRKYEPAMAKDLEEAIEVALVKTAQDMTRQSALQDSEVYARLVALYGAQPNLAQRTSTSLEQQAFSTPAPLAYLSSRLVNILPRSKVYEPTAGNGMLLMEATPRNVIAGELNEGRTDGLRRVFGDDATILPGDAMAADPGPYDVFIANPPFGKIRDDQGRAQTWDMEGVGGKTARIDHAITMKGLAGLPADGRAVVIIGGQNYPTQEERRKGYTGEDYRKFFKKLYDNYNVTEHFTVDGDLYAKQGAAWPVDVIVIEGRGASKMPYPMREAPVVYSSWEALGERLDGKDSLDPRRIGDGTRDDRSGTAVGAADDGEVSGRAGRQGEQDGSPGRAGAGVGDTVGDGGGRGQPDVRGAPGDGRRNTGLGQRDAGGAVGDARGGVADRAGADQAADQPGAGATRGGDARGVSRDTVSRRPVERVNTEAESAYQVQYAPRSQASFAVGTLVPRNMQQAMRRALDDLERRVGDIDTFVANELGYDLSEVIGSSNRDGYFSAEQVDALAMAIDNVSQVKGFIIGDQTGVGKGRFVAAMLRYANRKGMVPVFLTKDPGLYADMVRDMRDIGMEDAHKRALPTNVNLRGKNALPLSSDPNDVMVAPSKAKMDEALRTMQASGRLPDGYDMLFTTYSQLQQVKGQDTERMHAMRSIAPNAMFVLDESHEAGGGKPAERAQKNEDGTAKVTRSDFVRELLGPSQGAVFSSATYAKNPSVMSLYFKTDLSLMTDKLDELPTVIEAGGVPLQQVIANMLVESGQYARRERTFEGVEMNLEQLVTDKDVATRGAEVLRRLFELDVEVMQDTRETFIAEAGKEGIGGVVDTATGKAGMTSINFSSVMHNVAAQYLLAIKVDAVVEQAVALHRAGKKPIIALSNTNAAIIAEHAEKMGVQSGQGLDVPFNVILERYLDRLRRITVKDENDETSYIYLTDAQINAFGPPGALEAFHEARDFIQSARLDGLPGAPIDAILDRLEAAGLNAGEITGRNVTLRGNILERRDNSAAAKKRTMAAYNIGDLDALVINRSGSTGFSMHATDKPENDGKPRHMIILQPEPNIDLFMQMLGRIHRTGQTKLPGYTIAVSDLAVEKRPAAVLMKKMASLNANTTASKRSAVSLDNVTDFLNPYGDKVVAEFLKENPELANMLDMKPSKDIGGIAAKFTGRLMSMRPDDVTRIYEQIEASYTDFIEALDRMGMNALEAKVLELDARTVSKVEVVPAKESDSPFGAPAYVETVDVKRLGKPYSPEQLEAEIQKATKGEEPRTVADGLIEKLRAKLPTALDDIKARKAAAERRLAEAKTDKQKDAAQDSINRAESAGVAIRDRLTSIERMIDGLAPGRVGTISVRLGEGEGAASQEFAAVSLGVDISRVKENPTVASAMTVRLAIADAGREIRVPLSKFLDAESDYTWWEMAESQRGAVLKAFEEGQTESRETRQVITGNIPAGFSQFKKGQIILYTDADGGLHQGVMLPKNVDAGKALANRPVRMSPAQVVEFLQEGNHGSRVVTSEDDILRVSYNEGEFAVLIKTQGSKKYTLNKQVRELVGDWEQRRGAKVYRKRMGAKDFEKVLTIYAENLGTEYSTTIDRDVARSITGEEVPEIASIEDIESGQSGMFARSRDPEGRFQRMRRSDDDIPVGGVRYETTPEARKKAAKVAEALRAELDKTGLPEIDVATSERLFGKMPDGSMVPLDGAFVDGVISVALNAERGVEATVRHETIHALRDPNLWGRPTGLFRPAEWKALEAAARADKARMAEIRETYAGFSEEVHLEEAIADMYADWADGRLEAKGFLKAAFQRIQRILEAVRNVLRRNGFRTTEDVFRAIAEGEVGRRSREGNFKRWFGRSKIVDRNGAPLVVYHGTDQDIEAFDPTRGELDNRAMYFTANSHLADVYTRSFGRGPGGNVMPVYLRIENPKIIAKDRAPAREVLSRMMDRFRSRETRRELERERRKARRQRNRSRNVLYSAWLGEQDIAELKAQGFDGVINEEMNEIIAFDPEQVKSVYNAGTFDPYDPRVSFASQRAPVFHSPLLRAVQGAKQAKAPAGDWKAILAKLPGVKKVEIEWLGVNEWLDAQEGQVTRDQLAEFIAANQVQVTEDVLTGEEADYTIEHLGPVEPDWEAEAEFYMDEARDELGDDADEAEVQERAEDMARDNWTGEDAETRVRLYDRNGVGPDYEGVLDRDGDYDIPGFLDRRADAIEHEANARNTRAARFEEYTEEGGENYREILLRVPGLHEEGPNAPKKERTPDGFQRISTPVTERKQPFVQSGHFEQENVVVHARVKDRRDASNGRVLFVEEIQSDLASKWREATESPEVTAQRRELQAEREAQSDEFEALLPKAEPVVAQFIRDEHGAEDFAGYAPGEAVKNLFNAIADGDTIGNRGAIIARAALRQRDAELYDRIEEIAQRRNETRNALLALGTEKTVDPRTPDTPFKEELAYQLMVKRLLREAAEKGYDKLAWTPGYMQAERWGEAASSVVENVEWFRSGADAAQNVQGMKLANITFSGGRQSSLAYDDAGKITSGDAEIVGKNLSQLLGPNLARQMLEEPTGTVTGQKITFPDSGYAIAYDQQIRKAVDKFVRKFGGRVKTDTSLNDMQGQRTSDGSEDPRPVWSVEITPEMRASARLSQPMFAITRPTKEQARTNRQVGRMVGEDVKHGVTHQTGVEKRNESFLRAIGSQPIDQAFRIPFAVFGGLDRAGRWRYGMAAEKRIRDLVTKQKMGFLTPLVERVRHGMIDRYGLPEEYVERDRKRSVDESLIAAEGAEHLEAIKAHDIGPVEAKVLQAVLTGEDVADADMAKLSEPIREAVDRLGAEAVELGLISAESYERNRGQYLHRVYAKDELDSGAFGRWAHKMFATRRRKIIGNQFKGRGIFEQVEADRILRDNEEFLGAKRGKPQKGDRFVILDLRSTTGTEALEGVEAPKGRLKKRVYWPADRAIPARFDNYENRGTFELRGFKGSKAILWRDFTREERLKMGEILDARYTIAKTYALMSQDLATGRFFKDVAQNEEWSRDAPPPEAEVDENPEEKGWLKRMWVDPSVQWVKVPSAKIGKSNTHRYGALAGRYVRADIWRDMQELQAMQTPTFWTRLLTQWKLNKTARSPVVHMNNVMSNFMLMDMADVRVPDLVAGIRSMAKGDAAYQEALRAGAFGADQVTQEFRQNVLEPLLREIKDDLRGGKGGLEGEIRSIGWIADRIVRLVKAADRRMVDAYQMEDQVFRMATYIRRRNQGFTVEEAAVEARDQFLNYDIRAPWINAARRSVLPFISYTYRAVPKIAQTVAERPWKLAKYFAIYEALNALAYTLAPSDWDEEEERKSMRDEEQGHTWVGTERMVRMPWLSDGNPVFLDIRRWVPAGDVFDTGGSDLPAWLHVGGPLVIGMELYLNKAAFTEDEIVNPLTDTAGERAAKRADFLYKSWMPSAPWVPNSWYQEKLARAIQGDALQWGSREPYDLTEAALSSVGVKLKPKDVEVGYLLWRLEFDRIDRELKAQASSLNRQRQRNLIDQETYNAAMERVAEKRERLREKALDTFPD